MSGCVGGGGGCCWCDFFVVFVGAARGVRSGVCATQRLMREPRALLHIRIPIRKNIRPRRSPPNSSSTLVRPGRSRRPPQSVRDREIRNTRPRGPPGRRRSRFIHAGIRQVTARRQHHRRRLAQRTQRAMPVQATEAMLHLLTARPPLRLCLHTRHLVGRRESHPHRRGRQRRRAAKRALQRLRVRVVVSIVIPHVAAITVVMNQRPL